MQKIKKRRPFVKWLVALGVVIVLLVAAIAAWQFYKYRLIRNELKNAVSKMSNGLYAIDYDKMSIDEVNGSLEVINLRIKPDTAMYKKMIADKKNPPLLLQLFIPELKITGIKTVKALTDNKIEGTRVEINNAVVEFYFAKKPEDSTAPAPSKEMYQQLLGKWKLIKADTVTATNASLAFIDFSNNKKMVEVSGIAVNLFDVWIDSMHSEDSTRYFFAKNIHVMAGKGTVKNKQQTYIYKVNGMDLNTATRNFSIKDIQIEPQQGEAEFAKEAIVQNDRFNFSLQDIALNNITLLQLMNSSVMADELTIGQSNFKIYRDLSYPRDNKSRVGTYPQQLLMDIAVPVSIKKIVFASAFIEYKENTPKSGYNGRVQFEKVNAIITHVTNMPSEINADNNCVLSFKASFLGMAPMQAELVMKLKDPEGRFSIKGSASGFDATKLNVILKPMALAVVERGTMQKLDFNFNCTNYTSDGTLVMLYDNLKLTLLKKDGGELKKKSLASFVANFVIKNANPLRKQDIRKAEVHYKRDTNRSFFNLIWKSVFTGAKETVGMKDKQ